MNICHIIKLRVINPFNPEIISNEPNNLCRVDRSMSIHLVCRRSCVFGVVAHFFWNLKRCCRALNCKSITIWIKAKGWKMKKIWPFKVRGSKWHKTILLDTWKCMEILVPTNEETIPCEPTNITYPHQQDGLFTKWIEPSITTFTFVFNIKNLLKKRVKINEQELWLFREP
jgi:hypothetical protein